jgi:hypothetical protein
MRISLEASRAIERAILKDLNYQVFLPSEEWQANLLEFMAFVLLTWNHGTPEEPVDCKLILDQIVAEYHRAQLN